MSHPFVKEFLASPPLSRTGQPSSSPNANPADNDPSNRPESILPMDPACNTIEHPKIFNSGGEQFNTEDARMLVGLAGCPPTQQPYICGWVVGGRLCNTPVLGRHFLAHLRDFHGAAGHDKAEFLCEWMGCGMQMNKESVLRHIMEMHLETKYPCSYCQEVFSRKHTLKVHMTRKHGAY